MNDVGAALDPVSIQQELKQLGHYVSQGVITGFLKELGVECTNQDEQNQQQKASSSNQMVCVLPNNQKNGDVDKNQMKQLQLGFQDMSMQEKVNSFEENVQQENLQQKHEYKTRQQKPYLRYSGNLDEIEKQSASSENESIQFKHHQSQQSSYASSSERGNVHDRMERPKTPCLPGMRPYSVSDLKAQRDRLQQEFERIQKVYYNQEEFIDTEDFEYSDKENLTNYNIINGSDNGDDDEESQYLEQAQSECSSIPESTVTSTISRKDLNRKQKQTIQTLPNNVQRTQVNQSFLVKGQSSKAAPKVDRVARYKQFEKQWNKSGFLRGRKEPNDRKRQNFYQAFQEAHQREAAMQLNAKLTSIKRRQSQKQVVHKYIAPHEKRRDDLRWQTRMKMNMIDEQ
eukprot:TRINITY_DN6430_c0_g3_i1.p1 TRINITY_DN6430_c0_g3~~TRINITY_DN6430_c0_g3_i1.p1  ORF type:complete len:399 (-),score=42.19 TRINITY_DN6430_c0_g3_i1:317-1513(-)